MSELIQCSLLVQAGI